MPILPPSAFAFCGPTYLGISPVIDAERSINLFPELEIGSAKSQIALIGRPGMSATPFITLPTSPLQAFWVGANRLFVVSGATVYELNPNGTIKTNYGGYPNVLNEGPVYFQANSAGTQFIMCPAGSGQIFNVAAGPPAVIQQVTTVGVGLGFYGIALEYLDGFFITIALGASLQTSSPNQINVSNLEDGTMWDPLNYVVRSGSADQVIALAVLNSLLWIFGERTIEIWYDAGNPLFPLARMQGGTINLGCLAAASVVKFYNTIMWAGADATGYCQIYMTQGLSPNRVSTPAIENLINQTPAFELPLMWAYAEQTGGHTFYVLNICNSAYQPTATYVYDLSTGLWHERVYGAAAWPVCFASAPGFVYPTGDAVGNFVGDGQSSGNIYFSSLTYPSDGGTAINYTRTAPVINKANMRLKYPRFELDCDIGTAQPQLSYSNNGGRSFNAWSYPLQQAQDQSAPGTFRRFYARQLGQARNRVYRVTISDSANLIRIINAYASVEPGTES
jgi:hypothetical protein